MLPLWPPPAPPPAPASPDRRRAPRRHQVRLAIRDAPRALAPDPANGRPHPGDGRQASRRPGRLALAAAFVLFVALALFGQRYHWVEEAGTAERDGYVGQAEQILHGGLPHDPYRPLLYPLLTAGLSCLLRDPFTAARWLSNLAAAALAWLAWATGRRLAGPVAGAWAMALLAVNPNLWILGQHVSTDMLFAALGAAALWAGLCYLERPGAAPALLAGASFAAAAFTRSNALFLLPALLLAWVLAARPARVPHPWRTSLGHLALAAGLAVLLLVPHWILRQAVFGSPFHDENWKNLAWKLYGYPDWSYLDRVPFRSAWEIVRRDPGGIVRGGLAELRRFAAGGIAQLLGTWAQVLLCVAGAAWALRGRRARPAAWLLFAWVSFLGATAFSFFTWGRLLLLLLPAAYALGFFPWGGALESWLVDWSGGAGRFRNLSRLVPSGLAGALVLLLAVKTFGFRLPAFVDHHPYLEVATLQRLDAGLPAGARLAGTSPFLGRYLRHGYIDLPDAFGPEVAQPALYYAKLARLLQGSGVVYLVVGETDLRDRPAALLGDQPPVDWLVAMGRIGPQRRVAVWKVREGRPAG
ncbi:MAG TPA: glycosyltransferase family 39 protein [Thermoanaerobaculia bacterium]|nr:glycosyltransferase family 39 protein [Thermoanaerobaculia bacterium]